jgi:hypothetical protein
MIGKRRYFARVVVTSALLCLASCTLLTEHPLSDEKTSKPDEGLIGDWIIEGSKNEIWRVIRRPGTKNSLELTIEQAGKEKQGPFTVFTTIVGQDRYMTVEEIDPDTRDKSYSISRYAWIDRDTLQPFALDQERAAKAISAGELQGKVTTKKGLLGTTDEVTVTGSPQSIADYLKKHGREVFPAPEDKTDTIKFVRKK